MFKIILVLCLVLAVAVGGTIAAEYKEAPLPHYNAEKNYGWMVKIPLDKPENVNNVLKVWIVYGSRAIFMDKDKDGVCDVVVNFSQMNPNVDLFRRTGDTSCEDTQTKIDKFLGIVEEKKIKEGGNNV